MGYQRIEYAVAGAVATIRLARPEARNAMDMTLKGELAEVIDAVAGDDNVRAVVLTGTGKAFCAGGDIEEMALNDTPVRSRSRLRTLLSEVFIRLAELEKPTIAAVNGHAHGSGLSLALACDLILASEDAVFSCAFVKVGLVPDCGALYFLPRRVPMTVAKDLIFTGRKLDSTEALRVGLINRVLPADDLAEAAAALATELAAGPTVALGLTKTLLARSLHLGVHDMAELEAFGQALAYSTVDHLAARAAFAAKSSPAFVGH